MQRSFNSNANALELRLLCIKQSMRIVLKHSSKYKEKMATLAYIIVK